MFKYRSAFLGDFHIPPKTNGMTIKCFSRQMGGLEEFAFHIFVVLFAAQKSLKRFPVRVNDDCTGSSINNNRCAIQQNVTDTFNPGNGWNLQGSCKNGRMRRTASYFRNYRQNVITINLQHIRGSNVMRRNNGTAFMYRKLLGLFSAHAFKHSLNDRFNIIDPFSKIVILDTGKGLAITLQRSLQGTLGVNQS